MIASARLLGAEARSGEQFLAGEPLSLAVEIEAREPVEAPLLQLELRDDSGLLIASDVAETRSARLERRGQLEATLTVPPLPLAFGRFHLRLGLDRCRR